MNVPRGLCFCADMAPTRALNTCTWWHDLPSAAPTNSSQAGISAHYGASYQQHSPQAPPPVHQTSLRVAPHQPPDSRASLALSLPRLSSTNGLGPACPWLPQVLSLLLHGSNDSSMSQCNKTSFRQKHGLKNSSSTCPRPDLQKPHSEPLSHENMISFAGDIDLKKNPPQGVQSP